MDLFDQMLNIRNIDKKKVIEKAISNTKEELTGLNEEGTCFIYSSYLKENLNSFHIPCRIIDTTDIGLDYQHRFVLVPNEEEKSYFLIDLTYSQFLNNKNKDDFSSLQTKGYMNINDKEYLKYLEYVNLNRQINNKVSLEKTFYLNEDKKIK